MWLLSIINETIVLGLLLVICFRILEEILYVNSRSSSDLYTLYDYNWVELYSNFFWDPDPGIIALRIIYLSLARSYLFLLDFLIEFSLILSFNSFDSSS